MLNLLFWNLKNNSIENIVAECLIENDVSLAAFAEYKGLDFSLLEELALYQYHFVESLQENVRIRLMVRNGITATAIQEQNRYSIFQIETGIKEYLLIAIHLEDRKNYDTHTRLHTIDLIKKDLEKQEEKTNCYQTIVIGDFNANPYGEELLSVYGFNAVMFKDLILNSEYREYNHMEYKHFYNPILDYISASNKMHGSFYHIGDSSTPIWHCIDQILLRKNLVECFEKLEYILKIGDTELIKIKRPDKSISDHLPLLAIIKEVECND